MDDGRKYIAVIVEYRSGVTSSFGSTRSCSSTTPGASLLKWLHAMTIASSIEHATPLRRCGGIGVGRMVRPDRALPAPRVCRRKKRDDDQRFEILVWPLFVGSLILFFR